MMDITEDVRCKMSSPQLHPVSAPDDVSRSETPPLTLKEKLYRPNDDFASYSLVKTNLPVPHHFLQLVGLY